MYMKYCPFCGATLMGGAVSYCAECGNEIKPLEVGALMKTIFAKKPKRFANKSKAKPRKPVKEPLSEPVNDGYDGYDGYYDDVQPIDSGRIHDRMDPELIKRIIIISAGAVLIIVLSVLLIFLL